jgi:hypothetical protein
MSYLILFLLARELLARMQDDAVKPAFQAA